MTERVVEAIRAGRPVILPTDTVYGLCSDPSEDAVRALYALKGRGAAQPTALIAASEETAVAAVPELRGQSFLRGPFTLVLPNPARRLPWLSGERPDTIGVRIPELTGEARSVVEEVGAIAATSANLPGGPDPHRLDDVPHELREGAAAELDGGVLPGAPSTVIDLTGPEPVVLREGAVSAADALARLASA